jgi:hypothetical protein
MTQSTIYGIVGGEKAGCFGSIKTKAPAHKSQISSESPSLTISGGKSQVTGQRSGEAVGEHSANYLTSRLG